MKLDEYTLTEFIGKGNFGEVYLTKKQNSDKIYATKRITKEKFNDERYNKYFINEIGFLRKLSHNNIIRFEDLKKTNNHYYIIMEYCNGGTLSECLEKYKNLYHRPFTEEIVQHIMRQIISAINYIHSLRIIHRDLKLDNILVQFGNEIDKSQLNLLNAEVKLIDFGLAGSKNPKGLLTTILGSPLNMDPIILKKINTNNNANKELGYDEKADIWSLGLICYQMLIGYSAFEAYNIKELYFKIEEGTYKLPTNLSIEVVSFLNAMLQYNSEKRLGASELIRHAFLIKNVNDFNKIDINKVSNKVYGGELKINIKNNNTIWGIFNEDDEKLLNNIPGDFLENEALISQSKYLEYLNIDDESKDFLIKQEPFNVEKNFIDKEFKIANSIPLDNLNLEMKADCTIPETIHNNQNMQNIVNINNIPAIDNNIQQIYNTPIRKEPIPAFQNNFNNNLFPMTPQIQNLAKNNLQLNNNMVARQLENGKFIKTKTPLNNFQQINHQINGQNNYIQNRQINNDSPKDTIKKINFPQQNQINMIHHTPIKQNIPINLNPNQFNQMNIMQNTPINAPKIQYPQDRFNFTKPQGIIQNQQNQNINNFIRNIQPKQLEFNKIEPNLIQNNINVNNQIQYKQIQNNINNQILQNNIMLKQNINNKIRNNINQKNHINNKQIINNPLQKQFHNKQISDNLAQNKFHNKQITINLVENQLQNRQILNNFPQNQFYNNTIPNNLINKNQFQNNKVPMNTNRNNQINHVQTQKIQNNFIQNNQKQNIIIPQNITPIRQFQRNQISPNKFPVNNLNIMNLNQQNKINNIQANKENIIHQQNQLLKKQNYKAETIQHQKLLTKQLTPQLDPMQINQQQMQYHQLQKGQIKPNQVFVTPQRGAQRPHIAIQQQNQIVKIPLNGQKLNLERKAQTPNTHMNNLQFQKVPTNNRNNYNIPNQFGTNKKNLKLEREINYNQLQALKLNANKQQNDINIPPRVKKQSSPNVQNYGIRQTINVANFKAPFMFVHN